MPALTRPVGGVRQYRKCAKILAPASFSNH
jgi:hypothetical protein